MADEIMVYKKLWGRDFSQHQATTNLLVSKQSTDSFDSDNG